MKQETFDKAQELQTNIGDLDSAISRLEKNLKDHNGFPTNFNFCYDEENEALKANLMQYLKSRRTKFQKEFDLLK